MFRFRGTVSMELVLLSVLDTPWFVRMVPEILRKGKSTFIVYLFHLITSLGLILNDRYCSMDYIILSALQQTGGIQRVLVSYDIACQWSKNLRKRMLEYADHLQLPEEMEIDVGIPSWHVNGHGEWCRSHLSLSYIPGVGRTCGEDIETTWSSTNPLVPSTREMGPAARRETLNDHWGGWNFRKIVTFRQSFPLTKGSPVSRGTVSMYYRSFISQTLQSCQPYEGEA